MKKFILNLTIMLVGINQIAAQGADKKETGGFIPASQIKAISPLEKAFTPDPNLSGAESIRIEQAEVMHRQAAQLEAFKAQQAAEIAAKIQNQAANKVTEEQQADAAAVEAAAKATLDAALPERQYEYNGKGTPQPVMEQAVLSETRPAGTHNKPALSAEQLKETEAAAAPQSQKKLRVADPRPDTKEEWMRQHGMVVPASSPNITKTIITPSNTASK